ncbi:MAG TPA: 5-formyltetrahydrofolate cyclo-ligase [Hyphomicrobiaceae bacterium]|nr:5-formyltetrahydrofolate cyclo-ligase [Hyphomicrobiaceae bacterium]
MSSLSTGAGEDILAVKRGLRDHQKALRAKALAEIGAGVNVGLVKHGMALLGERPPGIVSGYYPMEGEIWPLPLMAALRSKGHSLALPVMQGKGDPLLFRAWTPGDPLIPGVWGIRQPAPDRAVVLPDIVLVPLLAFDARGYRLGYGGGYYDRTLRSLRAVKPILAVGLALDELEVDAVPHLDYDERLDWVLTPSGARQRSD